jgi:MurNAc alpha-1-phosphate uridylyltransferase
MADSLAGLVLAAGSGSRLRPLTSRRTKAMCPVGDRPLVSWAIERVAALVDAVAVNARYDVDRLAAHVATDGVHVSDERGYPEELGTGGAVGALRGWLDGRAVLVVNGDTWTDVDLAPLVDGWDGERVRVLVHGPPGTTLASLPGVVGSLVPAADAARLPAVPLGLSNGLWAPARAEGRLDVLAGDGVFVSCDRPRDYLAANLAWSGGASVIGAGAVVEGEVVRSVVWPGAHVRGAEVLVDAIRADAGITVLVR